MFAIAPTDFQWFEQIRRGSVGDIVNFWTPTPWNVTNLSAGARLYFLLKAPIRKIGGYGEFVRYANMKASDAWSRFALGNGVHSLRELIERTERYASKRSTFFTPTDDPVIGCIILSNPVTFNDEEFFTPEEYGFSFPMQVVKIKYFPGADVIVQDESESRDEEDFILVPMQAGKRHRVPVKDRKGQSVFRRNILLAYGYRCSVTGVTQPEVLEASHIQPYVDERSNHIQNGLCLRVDLHRLFDKGLFTITDDFKIMTSRQLTSGVYTDLSDQFIRIPNYPGNQPSRIALEFHRTEVFAG